MRVDDVAGTDNICQALPRATWPSDEASTTHLDGIPCCRRRVLRAAPAPQLAATAGAGNAVDMLMTPLPCPLSSSAGVSRPSLAPLKVPQARSAMSSGVSISAR